MVKVAKSPELKRYMKKMIFPISLIICALYVVFAEGTTPDLFTLWNLTPIIFTYVLYLLGKFNNSKTAQNGSIGFAYGGIGLSLLFHTAWLFDWGGTATGSSTSGLIFLFLPIYSLITGGVGYGIGWFYKK